MLGGVHLATIPSEPLVDSDCRPRRTVSIRLFADRTYLPIRYTGCIVLATGETIQQRIARLRTEINEISRLNEEYLHLSHTLPVQETHRERRTGLEQIVEELKTLSSRLHVSVDL